MSSSLIDLNRATLDEMNIFLAEHLEGLRRCYNQRHPAHVADPGKCKCLPACYQGFDRDWTPTLCLLRPKNGIEDILFTPCGGQFRKGYPANTTIQVKNLDCQKKSMWRI